MNFTGSNKELVLVHKEMKKCSLDHSVNVMLTPQFYTMRREELPVKYLYQAKKIAPSLFEGFLNEDGMYEYFVFREDNQWVFIAYNPNEIKSFLLSKEIPAEYISKVFFAQQAPQLFTKPVVLNEREVLMTIDNSVVLVPKSVLSGEQLTGTFDKSFTPGGGISLPGNTMTLIGKKEAIILAAVFSVFAVAFFIEGWQYEQSLKVQKKDMQELLDAYPALQSKMQRESVALKYKMIDTKERKKRDIVKTLAAMLSKGVTLTSYHMNEKRFKAVFSCSNDKTVQKVETMAKKSHLNVTNSKGSNIVVIEGKL